EPPSALSDAAQVYVTPGASLGPAQSIGRGNDVPVIADGHEIAAAKANAVKLVALQDVSRGPIPGIGRNGRHAVAGTTDHYEPAVAVTDATGLESGGKTIGTPCDSIRGTAQGSGNTSDHTVRIIPHTLGYRGPHAECQ